MDSEKIISIENWQEYAKCKGNTDLFFDQKREDKAKDICSGCIVVKICLEEAIVNNEEGVWGGTNERDRRIIRRNRKSNN